MRLRLKGASKLLTIMFTGILAAGCASQQTSNFNTATPYQTGKMSYLPTEFSSVLSTALAGSSQFFTSSPFGEQVSIAFYAPYFAASGATCRHLNVSGNGSEQMNLACTQDGTQWYASHALVAGANQ